MKTIVKLRSIFETTTIPLRHLIITCRYTHGIPLLIAFMLICVTAQAQYDKMLIGTNNSLLEVANLDGSHLDTVSHSGPHVSFYDADVDPVRQKIYLAWYYGIYSMNYDGSDFKTLISFPSGGYSSGVAVDPLNGYLYWGITHLGVICRSNLDGTDTVTILSGLGHLGDVDLDPVHGYLFFGQYSVAPKGLFRVNLDGTNKTTIASGYNVNTLALDIKNYTIYFADSSSCRKVNYNGTNDHLLINFLQPGGFFVDTVNSLVYYSDIAGNRIISSNLNGAFIHTLITTGITSPYGPLLFKTSFTILDQPADQNIKIGDNAKFTVRTSIDNVRPQWQSDLGFGFQDISDAGQYSGSKTDTLLVSGILLSNNNEHFRCIITNTYCTDTTNVVILTVNHTGISPVFAEDYFSVFPNPAGSLINISIGPGLAGSDFDITDLTGRKVMKGKLVDRITMVEIRGLPAGLYLLSVGKEFRKTQKLVINRD